MADYTKYDARVDSLVIESRTSWDPSVGKLTDEDKSFLAKMRITAAQEHGRSGGITPFFAS